MGAIYFAGGSVPRCFQFVVVVVLTPMNLESAYAVRFLASSSWKSRSQIVIETPPKRYTKYPKNKVNIFRLLAPKSLTYISIVI